LTFGRAAVEKFLIKCFSEYPLLFSFSDDREKEGQIPMQAHMSNVSFLFSRECCGVRNVKKSESGYSMEKKELNAKKKAKTKIGRSKR
jgi:hypothetical protein